MTVLRAAAERLEREGWNDGPGDEVEGSGPCCVVQAIQWSAPRWQDAQDALLALRRVVIFEDRDGKWLTRWNDRQPSVEPVLAALRAAADRAEREGL